MKAKTEKSGVSFKRFICLLLVMLSVLTPVTSVLPGADGLGMVTTAEAANRRVHTLGVYFKKYTGKSNSIVEALKAIGTDSSYAHRKYIACQNGISNYTGTAAQNSKLLQLLKQGKLRTLWQITHEQPIPDVIMTDGSRDVTIQYCGSGLSKVTAKSSNNLKMIVQDKLGKKSAEYEWRTITVTLTGIIPGNADIVLTVYGNNAVKGKTSTLNIPVHIRFW